MAAGKSTAIVSTIIITIALIIIANYFGIGPTVDRIKGWYNQVVEKVQTEKEADIQVSMPQPGQVVSSPLIVAGQAQGFWFQEGSFFVEVKDQSGQLLGSGDARAQGDWTTEDFVPFSGTIEFEKYQATSGTVILHKANPSGFTKKARFLEIPVSF